ncbi:LysR family transcriptional regulator [Microbispora sp. CA-135349]|uniref:LysR family transcriptional regulator n=1 Tax=Microbispora sp. CA-135349 TaxID=3239953 RepID=UPI003D8DFA61
MDLSLLRAFVTLAAHRNYGRAARDLSVTQPTLTKQIQSLEARAGGRLFHRGRHGATLTDLGVLLLPDAHDLLRRADALSARMAGMANGALGRLAVGFGLSSIDLAPRAVALFRRRHPQVSVTLDDMSSQAQIEGLETGELDVGFVRLPVGDEWEHLTIGTDRLALAVSERHGPPPSTAADLPGWAATHGVIRLAAARGPGLDRQIDRLHAAVGVRPDVVQEAHDLQTVLALVAAGIGVAFVPAGAARIAPPTVTITPIDHPAAVWRIGVAWNGARRTAVIRNFLEVVREVCAV